MANSTLFISYAHEDTKLAAKTRDAIPNILDELRGHLYKLENEGRVRVWSDTDGIEAGDNWRQSIKDAMSQARIAVLLLSNNFFKSNFILNEELPFLIKRKHEGKIQGEGCAS